MSQFLPDLLLTLLYGMEAMFTHPGIILSAKEKLAEDEFKEIIKQTASNKAARWVQLGGLDEGGVAPLTGILGRCWVIMRGYGGLWQRHYIHQMLHRRMLELHSLRRYYRERGIY